MRKDVLVVQQPQGVVAVLLRLFSLLFGANRELQINQYINNYRRG